MGFWHCALTLFLAVASISEAFVPTPYRPALAIWRMASDDGPAGSFFNPVPDNEGKEEKDIDESLQDLLRERNKPAKASSPSTINGIPTSEVSTGPPSKPFVGVGPPDNKPINDPSNPEVDDQGFTLYADEETGEKSRVFEALVEYPCDFTMKIVGANEGTFVEDMVQVVADSCEKDVASIEYSTKVMGKWTSVTVHAPVENAEMLYALYENVDRDPRVKFKF